MRKIMVFQHVGHEPLGTLDPLLKAAGFRIRYINFGRDPFLEPDIESYNGLIVLGGPMGVYEANQHPHLMWEMKQIENAFKKNIPVLGICLGAQLIAHVLGSPVRKAPRWELGWTPIEITNEGATDSLFAHYKKTEKIFQIHQDTFDIPKNTVHLAKSDLCQGQAFRYSDNVYALQFHLEVDEPMITRWMKRQENHDIVYNSNGMFNLPDITSDTVTYMPRNLELSEQTFKKFIELFGLSERAPVLRSR